MPCQPQSGSAFERIQQSRWTLSGSLASSTMPSQRPRCCTFSKNLNYSLASLINIFQLCSAIAPTLKTMKTMAWEPMQADSKETAPSLFRQALWQDQVVSCLSSKPTSPLKISLEWGAWHKVRSNQLKAALLDSQPVFPVIPHMELLECRTENPNFISVFRRHPFDLTRTDAS